MFFLLLAFSFLSLNTSAKECYAVLVNGAGEASANHEMHEVQLKKMYEGLRAKGCKSENIFVHSASGKINSPDFSKNLPSSASNPNDEPNKNVINYASSYAFEEGKTVTNLKPATKEDLGNSLKTIHDEIQKKGDGEVFVYLNDHGNSQGNIVLWGETMSAVQYDQILNKNLPQAKPQIKNWADCCYCGTFNKMSYPNYCGASLADKFRPAAYRLNNVEEYKKSIEEGNPIAPQMSSPFVDELKSNPQASLENTSLKGQIDTGYFEEEDICRGGARNTLEAYMLEKLKLSDAPKVCYRHMVEYILKNISTVDIKQACNATPTPLGLDINSFSAQLNVKLTEENLSLLKKINEQLKNSKYNRVIATTIANFNKLSPADKEKDIAMFQKTINRYREQAISENEETRAMFPNIWENMLETVFNIEATPAEREEFKRIKQCLEEPLFSS